jgi:hypothetical protein
MTEEKIDAWLALGIAFVAYLAIGAAALLVLIWLAGFVS